jgi:methionyl-tRNA formyltransferase
MGSNMSHTNYVVATVRPWNIRMFNEVISRYPGNWKLVTSEEELTVPLIKKLKPKYIFFPHWNHKVPLEILNIAECICFHETPLPYGRGGSPIQNMIARGYKETTVTAIKMTEEFDAGPIYLQKPVSLEGLAEEIFIRISEIVANMIREIISQDITPIPQAGKIEVFNRRNPKQSEIPKEIKSLKELFDFIRMLDAEEYPRAFIRYGKFRLELSRPALKYNRIEADVKVLPDEESCHD